MTLLRSVLWIAFAGVVGVPMWTMTLLAMGLHGDMDSIAILFLGAGGTLWNIALAVAVVTVLARRWGEHAIFRRMLASLPFAAIAIYVLGFLLLPLHPTPGPDRLLGLRLGPPELMLLFGALFFVTAVGGRPGLRLAHFGALPVARVKKRRSLGGSVARWAGLVTFAAALGIVHAFLIVTVRFSFVNMLVALGLSITPLCSVVLLYFFVRARDRSDGPQLSFLAWLLTTMIFGVPWSLWFLDELLTPALSPRAYEPEVLLPVGLSIGAVHVLVALLLVVRGRRKAVEKRGARGALLALLVSLPVISCSSQELHAEYALAEVRSGLDRSTDLRCDEPRLVGETRTTHVRKWAVRAECAYADDTTDRKASMYFVIAYSKTGAGWQRTHFRRVGSEALAAESLAPVELPPQVKEWFWSTPFFVVPAIVLGAGFFAIVAFLLRTRREFRLEPRVGPGVGARPENPRPGQSKSHWTINPD